MHGEGITRFCKFLNLIQYAKLNQVVHLSHKLYGFQRRCRSLFYQIREIDMGRHVLFADTNIRILGGLMLPIAHQRPVRLSVKLAVKITVVDRHMVSPVKGGRDFSDPIARLKIDVRFLTFRQRQVKGFL